MAISTEQFTRQLSHSGLVAADDVSKLLATLPPERKADGERLARELVRQKKLTAFQAQQVYQGKGKHLVLGNYVALDKLGQGGMGMVLKANHRRMKRLVALKVLSPNITKTPEALRRFQREVEAAAKLQHPNIVTAFDADEASGTHFLVMQYVEGTDLSDLVKKQGPLSVNKALHCVIQAARGLEYAHANDVVHRDIKPANLLLDRSGTIKILDMGLARLDSAGSEQDQLTGTGQIMGTVDYMSPEQAADTKNADARSDIYSLGITLWFLLTGRPVYEGDTTVAKLMAHQTRPIPSLQDACPQASAQLQAVFARMVAKNAADRYQTMAELIVDLESCRTGDHSSPSVATAPPGSDILSNDFPSGAAAPGSVAAATSMTHRATSSATENTIALQSHQDDTNPLAIPVLGSPLASWAAPRRVPPLPWCRNRALWIAAGAGAALIIVGAIVFLLQSDDGVVRVEIHDPQIEVAVQGTGILLKQANNGTDVKLSPGRKTLVVECGDFTFETDKLVLKKGETVTVRVERLGDKLRVTENGETIDESPPMTADVAPTTEIPAPVVPIEEPRITPEDGFVGLVELIDPGKDVLKGTWTESGAGQIRGQGSNAGVARLEFPLNVRGSYRLHIKMTVNGGNEHTSFIIPVGSSQAEFVWGSHNNNRSGLGDIEGKGHDVNATTRRHTGFKNGQAYLLTIEVRAGETDARVTVAMDGKEAVNWFGPIARLSMPPSRALIHRAAIGIDTLRDIQFETIALQMIEGEAELARAGTKIERIEIAD
ncbi:MAG: serine/threonine protein kinase [Pirellulales bacterium]